MREKIRTTHQSIQQAAHSPVNNNNNGNNHITPLKSSFLFNRNNDDITRLRSHNSLNPDNNNKNNENNNNNRNQAQLATPHTLPAYQTKNDNIVSNTHKNNRIEKNDSKKYKNLTDQKLLNLLRSKNFLKGSKNSININKNIGSNNNKNINEIKRLTNTPNTELQNDLLRIKKIPLLPTSPKIPILPTSQHNHKILNSNISTPTKKPTTRTEENKSTKQETSSYNQQHLNENHRISPNQHNRKIAAKQLGKKISSSQTKDNDQKTTEIPLSKSSPLPNTNSMRSQKIIRFINTRSANATPRKNIITNPNRSVKQTSNNSNNSNLDSSLGGKLSPNARHKSGNRVIDVVNNEIIHDSYTKKTQISNIILPESTKKANITQFKPSTSNLDNITNEEHNSSGNPANDTVISNKSHIISTKTFEEAYPDNASEDLTNTNVQNHQIQTITSQTTSSISSLPTMSSIENKSSTPSSNKIRSLSQSPRTVQHIPPQSNKEENTANPSNKAIDDIYIRNDISAPPQPPHETDRLNSKNTSKETIKLDSKSINGQIGNVVNIPKPKKDQVGNVNNTPMPQNINNTPGPKNAVISPDKSSPKMRGKRQHNEDPNSRKNKLQKMSSDEFLSSDQPKGQLKQEKNLNLIEENKNDNKYNIISKKEEEPFEISFSLGGKYDPNLKTTVIDLTVSDEKVSGLTSEEDKNKESIQIIDTNLAKMEIAYISDSESDNESDTNKGQPEDITKEEYLPTVQSSKGSPFLQDDKFITDPYKETRRLERNFTIFASNKLKDKDTFSKKLATDLITTGIAEHSTFFENPLTSVTNNICSTNNYATSSCYFYQQQHKRDRVIFQDFDAKVDDNFRKGGGLLIPNLLAQDVPQSSKEKKTLPSNPPESSERKQGSESTSKPQTERMGKPTKINQPDSTESKNSERVEAVIIDKSKQHPEFQKQLNENLKLPVEKHENSEVLTKYFVPKPTKQEWRDKWMENFKYSSVFVSNSTEKHDLSRDAQRKDEIIFEKIKYVFKNIFNSSILSRINAGAVDIIVVRDENENSKENKKYQEIVNNAASERRIRLWSWKKTIKFMKNMNIDINDITIEELQPQHSTPQLEDLLNPKAYDMNSSPKNNYNMTTDNDMGNLFLTQNKVESTQKQDYSVTFPQIYHKKESAILNGLDLLAKCSQENYQKIDTPSISVEKVRETQVVPNIDDTEELTDIKEPEIIEVLQDNHSKMLDTNTDSSTPEGVSLMTKEPVNTGLSETLKVDISNESSNIITSSQVTKEEEEEEEEEEENSKETIDEILEMSPTESSKGKIVRDAHEGTNIVTGGTDSNMNRESADNISNESIEEISKKLTDEETPPISVRGILSDLEESLEFATGTINKMNIKLTENDQIIQYLAKQMLRKELEIAALKARVEENKVIVSQKDEQIEYLQRKWIQNEVKLESLKSKILGYDRR